MWEEAYLEASSYNLSPLISTKSCSRTLANEPGTCRCAFDGGNAAIKSKQLANKRQRQMKLLRNWIALEIPK